MAYEFVTSAEQAQEAFGVVVSKLQQILKNNNLYLPVKGKEVLVSQASAKYIKDTLAKEIKNAFREAGFSEFASMLQSADTKMAKSVTRRASDLIGKSIGEISATQINALASFDIAGIIGLQEELISGLTSSVLSVVSQNALLGLSTDKLIESVRLSDLLGKYASRTYTYINTAKRTLSQQAEYLVLNKAGVLNNKKSLYRYVGAPIQDNSHPECAAWYNKLFTANVREAFENAQGYPQYKGRTTIRWNCQHQFNYVGMLDDTDNPELTDEYNSQERHLAKEA